MAVTAAIQLGWLGTYGLREVATRCAQGAHFLFDEVIKVEGVEPISSQPFFREFAFRVPKKATKVLSRMAEHGILGGLSIAALNSDGPLDAQRETDHVILVTATERRTRADIELYAKTLAKAVN
jgi:glycine dehydrogenase subunit 1